MDISDIFKKIVTLGANARPPQDTSAIPEQPVAMRIGQIITARVLEALDENTLLLELNGETLRAETEGGVPVDREIALKIMQTTPRLVLKLAESRDGANQEKVTLLAALRSALPKQMSFDALSRAIGLSFDQSIPSRTATTAAEATTNILSEFDKLSFPVSQVISAQNLKKTLEQSGLFLEHRLAKISALNIPPPENTLGLDLKSLMLKAARAIETEINPRNIFDSVQRTATAALDIDRVPPTVRATNDESARGALATPVINESGVPKAASRAVTNLNTPSQAVSAADFKSNAASIADPSAGNASIIPVDAKKDLSSSLGSETRDIKKLVGSKIDDQELTASGLDPDAGGDGGARQNPSPKIDPRAIATPSPDLSRIKPLSMPLSTRDSSAATPNTSPTSAGMERHNMPATADPNVDIDTRESDVDPKNARITAESRDELTSQADTKLLQTLQKTVEGTLARQHVHQLTSLLSQSTPTPTWTFELPVRWQHDVHNLHLRIEQEDGRRDSYGKTPYSVTLAIDIEPLGPISARIALFDKQVSVTFYAENNATLNKAQREFPQLEDALSANGLQVFHLQCIAGSIANMAEPDNRFESGILDIKA